MITRLFNQAFTLYAKTETKTTGRVVTTYVEVSDYMGRYDPGAAGRTFLNDKITYIAANNFFCPGDVPVSDGDQIEFNSTRYEVLSVVNPFSKSHHLELLINEVKR